LSRLKGLDHAVFFSHTADPFVAFNGHLFVFPTFFDAMHHCKVPTGHPSTIQACVRRNSAFQDSLG
jgi:hypothetical protein